MHIGSNTTAHQEAQIFIQFHLVGVFTFGVQEEQVSAIANGIDLIRCWHQEMTMPLTGIADTGLKFIRNIAKELAIRTSFTLHVFSFENHLETDHWIGT